MLSKEFQFEAATAAPINYKTEIKLQDLHPQVWQQGRSSFGTLIAMFAAQDK
jgi:hypothetical protein